MAQPTGLPAGMPGLGSTSAQAGFIMPQVIAPETMQQIQGGPLQRLLGQYGLGIPQSLPQHFMFSDKPGPVVNGGYVGPGGFGYTHPRIATGIENAFLAAAQTPGGRTPGESISQIAGAQMGIPMFRLQRQIGMTLAPIELAANIQRDISTQTGLQHYYETGAGRQYLAEASMPRNIAYANYMQDQVGRAHNIWDAAQRLTPDQFEQTMNAQATLLGAAHPGRTIDKISWDLYTNAGKGEAGMKAVSSFMKQAAPFMRAGMRPSSTETLLSALSGRGGAQYKQAAEELLSKGGTGWSSFVTRMEQIDTTRQLMGLQPNDPMIQQAITQAMRDMQSGGGAAYSNPEMPELSGGGGPEQPFGGIE